MPKGTILPAPIIVQAHFCEHDVHFAHARGFVAKTSAAEISRVKDLLGLARVVAAEN